MGRARRLLSYGCRLLCRSFAIILLFPVILSCGASTSPSLLYGYGGVQGSRRFLPYGYGGAAARRSFLQYGYIGGMAERSVDLPYSYGGAGAGRSFLQDGEGSDDEREAGEWSRAELQNAAPAPAHAFQASGDGCHVNASLCLDQLVYMKRSTCCRDVCVNTRSDIENCGGCGVRCAAGLVCCKGSCVNLLSDNRHCGKCKHRCPDADCELGLCGYGT
ncbi:hypothetical protein L7F22_039927 [Adiantum nelumboides]|nr:hypothetical protein [Adiantum nelumboides]